MSYIDENGHQRTSTGQFDNNGYLGNTYTQSQAGVNQWDTSWSAQAKVDAYNAAQNSPSLSSGSPSSSFGAPSSYGVTGSSSGLGVLLLGLFAAVWVINSIRDSAKNWMEEEVVALSSYVQTGGHIKPDFSGSLEEYKRTTPGFERYVGMDKEDLLLSCDKLEHKFGVASSQARSCELAGLIKLSENPDEAPSYILLSAYFLGPLAEKSPQAAVDNAMLGFFDVSKAKMFQNMGIPWAQRRLNEAAQRFPNNPKVKEAQAKVDDAAGSLKLKAAQKLLSWMK